ncbi:uncharacterized protein LOC142768161 [Rhipicephalus microplus]|uniref:uncharacterized protein LOC142768161 n=1 Tax=Rhipicephalus microplus TaxID=6941 RepID=UPI003F6AB18D
MHRTLYEKWPKGGQKAVHMDTQKLSGCLRNCDLALTYIQKESSGAVRGTCTQFHKPPMKYCINRVSPAVMQDTFHTRTPREETKAVSLFYQNLLQHYRLQCRFYPSLYYLFSRCGGTDYRCLQSNAFTHGVRMHHSKPTSYDMCPHCNVAGTLARLLLNAKAAAQPHK